MSVRRGLLIAIEGLDRAGKSTQVRMLADHALCLRFPDRSSPLTGPLLAALLNGPTMPDVRVSHLLFTVNRWEAVPLMLSTLKESRDAVVDRYCHSGVAYSVAQGADPVWAWTTQSGLPKPDLVIYLRIEPGAAATRAGYGQEALETSPVQHAVFDQYEQWSGAASDSVWATIDATKSIESIHGDIVRAISMMESKRRTALSGYA